jgi:hypothetical protein
MSTENIILDLISDDRYLLWEVKSSTGDDIHLSEIIEIVINLIKRGIVTCSISPILGNDSVKILSSEDSIDKLQYIPNWDPPVSDTADAIWLELMGTEGTERDNTDKYNYS